jgi:dienelactone hydrolase
MGRWIDYAHGEQPLRGYFAAAESAGNAPGILIVHAWLGITDSIQSRADRVAALGYHAFACDVFGKPVDIARGPFPMIKPYLDDHRLFRDRLRAGLDTLTAQAGVDGGRRLAAMGYCFGGQAVLELARDHAPLTGVVSFHGELDTPMPAKPGDITGKVLVLTGDDDPVVPFEKIAGFRDEMRGSGVDFEVDLYSGAKHSFTGEGSLGPEKTPEAVRSPQADARSWARMMAFWQEIFP